MSEARKGPKVILSVGGGKGGTGKTVIASNMALYLAKLGQRVLLVDADLGGPNLHTCIGLDKPKYGLAQFFDDRKIDLTGFLEEANLSLLTGALDSREQTARYKDRLRLRNALRRVETDYVILDVGSGTSQGVMDFFLMGEIGICVMLPEPTSIENTYRFFKEILYRILLRGSHKKSIRDTLDSVFHCQRADRFPPISQLLQMIEQQDDSVLKSLRAKINDLSVRLVINQVQSPDDAEVGFAVRSAIHKHFGIRTDFVGYINFDELMRESVRMRQPLLQNFPDSKAARCIENITHKLLTQGQLAFDFY
jgi:flagellar biosynthesis protein FlhG